MTQLLISKLAVPAPPGGLVQRGRLHRLLDDGVRSPVTLLTAPAGWGKTVLLSSWVRTAGLESSVAWLSVEPGDEGERFWSYLRAALGLPELTDPAGLAQALAASPEPVILVIDDLHQIADRGVLGGLDFLLRHAAPRLRLVVGARGDPALALHPWRLRGELTEVRAAELAFTVAETEELLDRHGLPAAAGQAAHLRARTEGWPAGIRLAALSMREHPDPARFLAQFTGDTGRVADYLTTEFLAGQPTGVRDILLRTSIVERLCAGLVEALTGCPGGERMLAELDRASVFLMPADGMPPSWRRYHGLFGDLLRAELRRQDPQQVTELHRRAAGWLAGHGLPIDALRHALAAGDHGHATGILAEHWPRMVRYGQHGPPSPTIPAPAVPDPVPPDPELALAFAMERLDQRDPDGAGGWLRRADRYRHLLAGDRRERYAVMSAALRRAGDDDALQRHPEGAALALTALGIARLDAGELAEARTAFSDGLARAERAGLPCPRLVCASRLAFVYAVRGELRAAERTARAALDMPPCPGQSRTVHCAHAYLALAVVHLEWDRLADAEADLAYADGFPGEPALAAATAVIRAQLLADRGELAAGYQTLRRGLGDWSPPRYLAQWSAEVEADLRIRHGDTRTARHLVEATGLPVALARVRLAEGDPRGAIQALAARADDGVPLPVRLDAGLVEALAARRLGDGRRAHRALEQVLALAEPEGYRRPFLRARELLAEHLDSGTAYWSLVSDLLVTSTPTSTSAVDPLTDRELTVLRYLPSLLSTMEIAGSLSLSVNTVKTHVRNIYRKLHASRRRDAVRRARELHLL